MCTIWLSIRIAGQDRYARLNMHVLGAIQETSHIVGIESVVHMHNISGVPNVPADADQHNKSFFGRAHQVT